MSPVGKWMGTCHAATLQAELNTLRRNLFVTVNGNEVHTNRPDAVRLLWLESAFVARPAEFLDGPKNRWRQCLRPLVVGSLRAKLSCWDFSGMRPEGIVIHHQAGSHNGASLNARRGTWRNRRKVALIVPIVR